ncbi:hypothetical protein [Sinimarinibacterium flocculans]|uniref:hypothetical protein n=1 Tax=Sinimarinibacterium flocculans TaxID=985250 RepID=UPI0024926F92|nr:hypothetical protein [Sinimarinibacterium flocculans]
MDQLKDFSTVLAAAIAGLFALLSAFLAWRLRNAADSSIAEAAVAKERRNEVKALYTEAYSLFERAIAEVRNGQPFTLAHDFAKLNAQFHLLAPATLSEQYGECCMQLEFWSRLQGQASPKRMDVAGVPLIIVQSPDPTEKYREPAAAAYRKLQSQLQALASAMRRELSNGSRVR